MTFAQKLQTAVKHANSLLCVGLDPDLTKLPASVRHQPDALFMFNRAIIDATADLVCCFKPNSAFYESSGADGIHQLQLTIEYIKEHYPHMPVILDAKRADVGNTNEQYTQYAFEYLQADGITLNPYLGREALEPFLAFKDKGMIILCRNSNPGAGEFQDLQCGDKKLYEIVAENISKSWNKNGNCLLVVGATRPEELQRVRQIVGQDMVFLVPGVGSQGGDIAATLSAGLNEQKTGIIINSSREVLYASAENDFAEAARAKAQKIQGEINEHRR